MADIHLVLGEGIVNIVEFLSSTRLKYYFGVTRRRKVLPLVA